MSMQSQCKSFKNDIDLFILFAFQLIFDYMMITKDQLKTWPGLNGN